MTDVLDWLRDPANIAFAMLLPALALTFVRLLRGPSLPDRVLALEVVSMVSVASILVYAIDRDQEVFLDVAIVLALISFLGAIAFAQYLERRGRDE